MTIATEDGPTLGKSGARPVAIDVGRLITTRLLVQSNSGGGKSWAVRRILEQTHGHAQQIVLDSEGEFFTLREKFDFVLAGRGGDCQAHPRSAATLARKLLELGVSAVIDLSDLPHADPMRHVDRATFVANFCRGMLDAPRELWHPTLVILDEAHRFCPEGEPSASAAAVADLASAGRKRAFAVVLATQRISKLSKSAAAECNNRLVGRTGLDVDQRRAADELGFTTREARLALRSMTPGTFHVFGPAFDVTGVELVRIGDVKTTHPEPGGKPPPVAPPRGKVVQLLAKLAAVPEQAEEEARTLEAALAESRKLKGELAALRKAGVAVDPAALAKAREEGREEVRRAMVEAQKKLVEWFGNAATDAERLATGLRNRHELQVEAVQFARNGVATTITPTVPTGVRRGELPVLAEHGKAARTARVLDDDGKQSTMIDGGMQRVLDAIVWLEVAGVTGPYERKQVAALSNYALGGTFSSTLSRCHQAGLIEYVGAGCIALMADGRDAANAPTAPTTSVEIQARVLDRCDGGMRRCLEPLLAAYPNAMPRASLAEAASYAVGGTFSSTLSRLSTMGAIEYRPHSQVVAAPWLFIAGT